MLTLRDYQTRILADALEKIKTHRSVLVTAPTGSGKRILAVELARLCLRWQKKMAFVTDRRQLIVPQMSEECDKWGIPYGVIMGSHPTHKEASIQLCSIQTLKRRRWIGLPNADLVVIDEAHKETKAYQELMRRYERAKFIGLTATPVGAGGTSLCSTA